MGIDCPKLLSIRGPIFEFLLEDGALYRFPPFWEQYFGPTPIYFFEYWVRGGSWF